MLQLGPWPPRLSQSAALQTVPNVALLVTGSTLNPFYGTEANKFVLFAHNLASALTKFVQAFLLFGAWRA